mmetsp:Transcript_5599/g.12199  ORF Transcript_5599/g.12199 Transcript_5599/m.12199 type:complete len:228 (+) Transcript_5599:486-1169(+)
MGRHEPPSRGHGRIHSAAAAAMFDVSLGSAPLIVVHAANGGDGRNVTRLRPQIPMMQRSIQPRAHEVVSAGSKREGRDGPSVRFDALHDAPRRAGNEARPLLLSGMHCRPFVIRIAAMQTSHFLLSIQHAQARRGSRLANVPQSYRAVVAGARQSERMGWIPRQSVDAAAPSFRGTHSNVAPTSSRSSTVTDQLVRGAPTAKRIAQLNDAPSARGVGSESQCQEGRP